MPLPNLRSPAYAARTTLVALAIVVAGCASSPHPSTAPAAATPAASPTPSTATPAATPAPVASPTTPAPSAPATSTLTPTPSTASTGPVPTDPPSHGPTATARPSATPGASPTDPLPSALLEAIPFVPASSGYVMFTDWARIKHAASVEGLTGAASLDTKLPFLLTLNQQHASATGFGLNRLRGHYEFWGWDALDFDWEAQWLDGSPVWMLQFRDGVDLTKTIATMTEAGFESRRYEGVTIRSHRLDLSADWATTTEFAISNTAFLHNGRSLLLSSSPEALERALDTAADGTHAQASNDQAVALGAGSALMMLQGTDACQRLSPRLLPGLSPQLRDETLGFIEEAGMDPYDAFAMGYDTVDGEPVGVIAFHFPDEATAQAQAPKRERIAATGLSLRTNRPFNEVVFTVTDRTVQGEYVFLKVAPAGGIPKRLFDALLTRDAWFAAC